MVQVLAKLCRLYPESTWSIPRPPSGIMYCHATGVSLYWQAGCIHEASAIQFLCTRKDGPAPNELDIVFCDIRSLECFVESNRQCGVWDAYSLQTGNNFRTMRLEAGQAFGMDGAEVNGGAGVMVIFTTFLASTPRLESESRMEEKALMRAVIKSTTCCCSSEVGASGFDSAEKKDLN